MALLGLVFFSSSDSKADFTFGEPVNLGATINSTATEQGPSISADGLSLYFSDHSPGVRPGGHGGADLWVATRPKKDDPWCIPVNLGPVVNSTAEDEFPDLSADGLSLYFCSNRAGGSGHYDLWVTNRATTDDPWQEPVNLGSTVNSTYGEAGPRILTDGLSLLFHDFLSPRPGGYGGWDSYVTTRATASDPWSAPVNLGPVVNGPDFDAGPNISANGLIMFLHSSKPGGPGGMSDLWMTRRETRDADWETPINLGPVVNAGNFDATPDLSSDGSTLYFCSERPGGFGSVDLWQVPICPLVDFTGDYRVDIEDLTILIEHWGTGESLCDIGPMPWGDGVVDAQDLEILMRDWEKELPDPNLLAHWKLDDTEGMFAVDSVGENNGIVFGNAEWKPEGGQFGGALEFDGTDDMVIAGFVLNPEEGPFSAFAWIKGSTSDQVIISQQGGVNWLMVDMDGRLITELKSDGRRPSSPLYSETPVTDDNWHKVGFVWDGAQRTLYVDDLPVATDSQTGLGGSAGGLVIGTGQGAFWSGMIDDVRIYDRVVVP